jgi:formyltetrahydrofolate-dependent phosphoribosylglycinamide formyltransferase
MPRKPRIAILISGTGSNMEAIISACRRGALAAEVALVISDNQDAAGIGKARSRGIETLVVPYEKDAPREKNESPIVDALKREGVEWVVLAGYMKILSAGFVRAFPNRIANIHPALLPAFPGARAVKDALEAGADVTGVTIHIVDEYVDHGTIIAQEEVPILPGDTEETLAARIHAVEHRLYPRTLQQLFHDDI